MRRHRLCRVAHDEPQVWYMYHLPETLKTETVISHLYDIRELIQKPQVSAYVGMSADACKEAIETYGGGTVERKWLDESGLPITGTEEVLTADQFLAECDE